MEVNKLLYLFSIGALTLVTLTPVGGTISIALNGGIVSVPRMVGGRDHDCIVKFLQI